MNDRRRLVSEIHTPEGTLVIRQLDTHGFGGGHYRVTVTTRANGRTVSLDLTLAELLSAARSLGIEIERAAHGG